MASPQQAISEKPPELYYHDRLDAYECLGCGEFIEVPRSAMLKIEGIIQRVQVRKNPEHLLIWRELHEIDHSACGSFKDEAKAKDYREHRSVTKARPAR